MVSRNSKFVLGVILCKSCMNAKTKNFLLYFLFRLFLWGKKALPILSASHAKRVSIFRGEVLRQEILKELERCRMRLLKTSPI